MQSLKDEFDTHEAPKCKVPVEPGRILVRNEANDLSKERLKCYQR